MYSALTRSFARSLIVAYLAAAAAAAALKIAPAVMAIQDPCPARARARARGKERKGKGQGNKKGAKRNAISRESVTYYTYIISIFNNDLFGGAF